MRGADSTISRATPGLCGRVGTSLPVTSMRVDGRSLGQGAAPVARSVTGVRSRVDGRDPSGPWPTRRSTRAGMRSFAAPSEVPLTLGVTVVGSPVMVTCALTVAPRSARAGTGPLRWAVLCKVAAAAPAAQQTRATAAVVRTTRPRCVVARVAAPTTQPPANVQARPGRTAGAHHAAPHAATAPGTSRRSTVRAGSRPTSAGGCAGVVAAAAWTRPPWCVLIPAPSGGVPRSGARRCRGSRAVGRPR